MFSQTQKWARGHRACVIQKLGSCLRGTSNPEAKFRVERNLREYLIRLPPHSWKFPLRGSSVAQNDTCPFILFGKELWSILCSAHVLKVLFWDNLVINGYLFLSLKFCWVETDSVSFLEKAFLGQTILDCPLLIPFSCMDSKEEYQNSLNSYSQNRLLEVWRYWIISCLPSGFFNKLKTNTGIQVAVVDRGPY